MEPHVHISLVIKDANVIGLHRLGMKLEKKVLKGLKYNLSRTLMKMFKILRNYI